MRKDTPMQAQENIINVEALNANKPTECQSAKRNTVQRWSIEEIVALYELPLNDLLYKAHTIPYIEKITTLTPCRSALCCRLKQVVVVRTVAIARRQRAIILRLRMSRCCP